MSQVIYHAVIVTAYGYVWDNRKDEECPVPDIEAFRDSLPTYLRPLVVGPIEGATGRYKTILWAPDCAQGNGITSGEADKWRQKFIDLFSFTYEEDGSSPFEVVQLTYGPYLYQQDQPPTMVSSGWKHHQFLRETTVRHLPDAPGEYS